jgi:hypothetical protein
MLTLLQLPLLLSLVLVLEKVLRESMMNWFTTRHST